MATFGIILGNGTKVMALKGYKSSNNVVYSNRMPALAGVAFEAPSFSYGA